MTALHLHNFAMLDVAAGELRSGHQALIRDGVIAKLEKGAVAAEGAPSVDLGGRTLMPGLIDCHVHLTKFVLPTAPVMLPSLTTALAGRTLEGMLMRGFTTVRDAGGADAGHRQAVEQGLFTGPRLFVSGRFISQTGGHADSRSMADLRTPCPCAFMLQGTGRLADGVPEVRKAVRDEIRLGADQIKIMGGGGIATQSDPIEMQQYAADELAAAVDEAARSNKYVMSHVYVDAGIRRCVEAGVRTIEHGSYLGDDTAKMMAARGTYLCPTQLIFDVVANTGIALGFTETSVAKAKEVLAVGLRGLDIARRAGVKMAFATDLARVPERQGEEFLVRSAVLSPAELIRSATLVGAEVVRMAGRIGVVAQGAIADLLAIDGNPLEDIRLLTEQGRWMPLILKEGRVVKNSLVMPG